MNRKIVYAVFFLLMSTGCHKDAVPSYDQHVKRTLAKINSKSNSSESKIILTYDENSKLVGNSTTITFPENSSKSIAIIKYKDGNFISEIISNEVYKLKFYYDSHGLIHHTEEFDHTGRLAVTHTYHYDKSRYLKEIIDSLHLDDDGASFIKNSYHYDQNGNLAAIKVDIMNPGSVKFVPWHETHYEDYDNSINPLPFSMNHPYIALNNSPRHNARKITSIEAKTGRVLSILKNEYVYDDNGYPLLVIQRGYFGSDQLATKIDYTYN